MSKASTNRTLKATSILEIIEKSKLTILGQTGTKLKCFQILFPEHTSLLNYHTNGKNILSNDKIQ